MNTPQKPQDPPSEGAAPNHNPTGRTEHGIPDEMQEHEPKGTPSSDRHQTETTPKRS